MKGDRWLPLIWSSLGYPGVGQFLQRRRAWALVWGLAFTFFALLSVAVLGPSLWDLLRARMSGAPDPVVTDWNVRLRPLYLTLAIYAANLYDVWWHTIRPPPPLPGESP